MIKEKNKRITINHLAIMVASGFESMDTQFDKIEKDISDLKSDIKTTREDILNMNDKFVPLPKFDELASRVTKLEKGKNNSV